MKLEVEHRPRSRGVSQLMYVGDDDAVENATSGPNLTTTAQLVGVAALAYAVFGPKKHRSGAGVAGAALVALPYVLRDTMRHWSP